MNVLDVNRSEEAWFEDTNEPLDASEVAGLPRWPALLPIAALGAAVALAGVGVVCAIGPRAVVVRSHLVAPMDEARKVALPRGLHEEDLLPPEPAAESPEPAAESPEPPPTPPAPPPLRAPPPRAGAAARAPASGHAEFGGRL